MSLLREIQDAAVDGSSDLETLLRKCRVLATRLKHEELTKWVMAELDGYPGTTPLPSYRTFHVHCFGHFWGAFGKQMQNMPIPEASIPNELRGRLTFHDLRQGVGALEHMLNADNESTIRYGWSADITAMLSDKILEDMALVQAWSNLPKAVIVNVFSTVRNRILSFALDIGASYPDAGEAAPGETPVPKEVVTHIFNQTFNAPVANVASGHAIQQTGTINIQQGDFRTLATFLKENGVANDDIQDLEVAIKADPKPARDSKTFGKKVSAWIGKMVAKSAEGAWKVGSEVASKLLVEAIKSHYGLP